MTGRHRAVETGRAVQTRQKAKRRHGEPVGLINRVTDDEMEGAVTGATGIVVARRTGDDDDDNNDKDDDGDENCIPEDY